MKQEVKPGVSKRFNVETPRSQRISSDIQTLPWAITAFIASLFLIFQFIPPDYGVLQLGLALVSLLALIFRHRTGPFPFFIFFLAAVGTLSLRVRALQLERGFNLMDLISVFCLCTYFLAIGEFETLRYGITQKKSHPMKVKPSFVSAFLQALVWGGLGWFIYVFTIDLFVDMVPPRLGRSGLVHSLILFWGGMLLLMLGGLIIGFMEIKRANRMTNYMFLQDQFWRPHRKIFGFVNRMLRR